MDNEVWHWKCCGFTYLDRKHCYCFRCGRARPYTLRMQEINCEMAALDERDELVARIESLERQCQYNWPPLSGRVEALEAWQKDVMAETFRSWQLAKAEPIHYTHAISIDGIVTRIEKLEGKGG